MKVCFAVLLVLALFGFCLPAEADMIEIKNRGVLNGKILSSDDKEVRFEDTAKNLFVVPKADVLFLEAQKDAPVTAEKGASSAFAKTDWKRAAGEWRDKIESAYHKTKRFLSKKTEGIRNVIMKPLDRSAADSKSEALADSMAQLSTNLAKMNKNDRKRMVQMRGIKDDSSKANKLRKASSSGGNFASLD